jgi:Protein of unknown function (DUF3551)
MRLALIALGTLTATLASDMRSVSAEESFFNDRYCTQGGTNSSGGAGLDCAYHTWQQCIASARGLGRYCKENPAWHPQASSRSEPSIRQKTQRHGQR